MKFDGDRVNIIAEVGNNHEGDFQLAMELVESAAASGADAVKFQTITPSKLVDASQTERIATLEKFALSFDQFKKLSAKAKSCGINFFSTAFDFSSLALLDSIQDIFKVASGDNNWFEFLKANFSYGKPTIVSTGLCDDQDVTLIYKTWVEAGKPCRLGLAHCVSGYPAPMSELNLSVIAKWKTVYPDVQIGYSDHSLGNEAAITAVSLGARFIEKHFTIDKKHSSFRDHQLSCDPKDLSNLVSRIRETEAALGDPEKRVQKCEVDNLSALRRSYAASRHLSSGTVLTEDHLLPVRPNVGISVNRIEDVVGKTLQTDLQEGSLIFEDQLK